MSNFSRGGSGGVDATAIHKATAAEISTIPPKAMPTTSDLLVIEDDAAANAKKKITIGDLPGAGASVALSTVTVNQANYVIDPGVAATGPFFLVVNGIMYSDLEGFFIVSGVDNRTWTWQDIAPTGQLTTTDRVLTWHY
jgi:hypothetical protein